MRPLQVIEASVDEAVLERVTRVYAGTVKEVLTELLHNARRARARTVEVRIEETCGDDVEIVVADDGEGVAQPQVLLQVGASGWDEETAVGEDAAGMGLLALAANGCTVRSRRAGAATGWRVRLAPEHFRGEAKACVWADVKATPGTTVAFRSTAQHTKIRAALRDAARYATLEVRVNDRIVHESFVLGGRDFLAGCEYRKTLEGAVLGITRGGWDDGGEEDLCWGGQAMRAGLPTVHTLDHETWVVRAVVVPGGGTVRPVLPGRERLVEDERAGWLREEAAVALYEALAHEDAETPWKVWDAARRAGVELPQASPRLVPWQPECPSEHVGWGPRRRAPEPRKRIDEGAIRIGTLEKEHGADADALLHTLSHAVEATPRWRGRCWAGDAELEGYEWYDAMDRLVGLRTLVRANGQWRYLESAGEGDEGHPPWTPDGDEETRWRVEAIEVRATVASADGSRRVERWETDLAIAGESIHDARALATAGCLRETDDVATQIMNALWLPDDGYEAESWERQHELAREEAWYVAERALDGRAEALKGRIAEAARREVSWLVPSGQVVRLSMRRGAVEIEMEAAE